MNRLILLTLLPALFLNACRSQETEADAYGHFEATELLISSEASGRLLEFTAREGERIEAGTVIGRIDTVQVDLQRHELLATRSAVRARAAGVLSEIVVLEEQRRNLEREQTRVTHLLEASAATPQQFDDISGQIRVIDQRIAAIRRQNQTVLSEIDVLDARAAQVDELMRRTWIVNPAGGTVLKTYAEPFELVSQGRPLYRIADLSTMYVRAYLTGDQLADVRLGQEVDVMLDDGTLLPGLVSWMSAQAEFTPRSVRTKQDRADLVYAFKVRVANPGGRARIGMPAEINFRRTAP